jgi:hypothetical protein
MAQSFAHHSEVGTYTPYHFNATQSSTLIATDHTHGTFLGTVVINQAGTSDVITLSNGSSNTIAVIHPVAGATYTYRCKCDQGLFVTIAGTAGDYTINAKPGAI